MDLNHQKEQFSIAYVHAVASAAGFGLMQDNRNPDDESIDLEIVGRGIIGQVRSPRLGVQMKCTSANVLADEHLSIRIPLKNYDDLRDERFLVPRILVVVYVPDDINHWLCHSEDKLALHHCGYWKSLSGMEAYTGKGNKVTIHIPRNQQFTVESLKHIMNEIAQRRF